MNISKRTINVVTVFIGTAFLILIGLTFYNYYLSGEFDLMNLVIAGFILLITLVARTALMQGK